MTIRQQAGTSGTSGTTGATGVADTSSAATPAGGTDPGVIDAIADGDVSTAWQEIMVSAGRVWNFELFTVDETQIKVSQLIIAALVLVIGTMVARIVARRVGNKVLPRFKLESGPRHAIQTILFYLMMFGVVMLSLQTAGVPLTVFTIFGGALALGIGFGSQNIMNNFISGLILLIERPIAIDQTIELSGDVGKVTKIGARSTHLEGYNGEAFIIPNSLLLENTVKNWSIPDRRHRSQVGVGVAYGSDTGLVRDILTAAMNDHPRVLDEECSVLFTEFGDNALNFEAHFWTKPSGRLERFTIESEIRFAIDDKCRAAGVSIAFPQRDIHLDTISPLQVRVMPAE